MQSTSGGHSEGLALLDVIYLATGLAFFAVMALYAGACERL